MREKKSFWPEVLLAFGALVVWFGIGYLVLEVLPGIGHPFFYFLSVFYEDSLRPVVLFFLILYGVTLPLRRRGRKEEVRRSFRRFFLVACLWIWILNSFPVKGRYESVLIDGEKPTKLSYKAHILRDVLSGETKVEELPAEKVTPLRAEYDADESDEKGRTSQYVKFETEEGGVFASYESLEVWNYVFWMKRHGEAIPIEYYVHSGMLKSINGIDKNDSETLRKETRKLEEELRRKDIWSK